MTATHINGNGTRVPRGILFDAHGGVLNRSRDIDAQTGISNLGPLWAGGGTGYANYGANLQKNSLAGWIWRGGDADRDIGWNVQILRERSRDAFMGIPLASAAIETLDTNVIGEGLYPAPNIDGDVLGLDEETTAALNKEIADKFSWWAEDPRECDFSMRDSFYTLQHTAFQSMLLSGDCPVLFPLVPRPNTLFELRLRVLEADRIRNPILFPTWIPTVDVTTGASIFNGVELDKLGQLVAYHISEIHPLASPMMQTVLPTKTFRVEPFGALTGRRNMVLLMRPERPEQRRGVPILSVCLEVLKQMGRYIDSTVVGAVIQSYFTAFVTSEFPDPTIFDSLLTDAQKQEIFNFNPYNVQLGPGIVNFMRPGHSVNFANPTMPQATFGDFTTSVVKFIGAALGIPSEVLLKQFNASYSASRAALLDFWRRVRKWRALMIDQMCQPVYEEWLADAVALGRIENFPGGFDDPLIRKAMLRCIWTGASAGSLDPQKEVIAADLKVKCGFSTIERESAELNGSNYRDNIRQQATELEQFKESELIFPPYRPTQVTGLVGAPATEPAPSSPAGPPKPAPAPAPAPKPKLKARARNRLTHVELAGGLSGVFSR